MEGKTTGEGASSMKVFVLALDALDYRFVKRWRLRHLLQKQHGIFYVGEKYWLKVEDTELPFSPKVWTSFITGLQPQQHKVTSFYTYGRVLDMLRTLPPLASLRNKHKITSKFGLKPQKVNHTHLQAPTIFDKVSPSIAINVLSYNPEQGKMSEAVDGWIRNNTEKFEHTQKQLFKRICEEWELFMFYTNLPDVAGHCFSMKKLKTTYCAMNDLAFRIKEQISDACIFLIVSDHGMTKSNLGKKHHIRVHTKYGFYSFNRKIEWQPLRITDFYAKILEWTQKWSLRKKLENSVVV